MSKKMLEKACVFVFQRLILIWNVGYCPSAIGCCGVARCVAKPDDKTFAVHGLRFENAERVLVVSPLLLHFSEGNAPAVAGLDGDGCGTGC